VEKTNVATFQGPHLGRDKGKPVSKNSSVRLVA
jgi:hypothetical protein